MFTCPHCSGVYYINLSGEFEIAQHEPVLADTFELNQQTQANLHIDSVNGSMNEMPAGSIDLNSEGIGVSLMSEQGLIAADNVYEGTQLSHPQFEQQNQLNMNNDFQMHPIDTSSEDNQLSSDMNHFSVDEPNVQPSNAYLQPTESQVNMTDKSHSDNFQASQTQDNYNFDQPLDQVLQQSQNSSDAIETTDISDEPNLSHEAGQWYQLTISGIDTVQIRELIEEALIDQKLKIDLNQLLSEIIDGQLVIKGLNAVKCSVIAQRLIYVDVKFDWSRYE